MLGYLFGSRTYTIRHAVFAFLTIVVCTWGTGYATFILTQKNNGILVSDFTSNFSPSVIIASVAWFVLIKSVFSAPSLDSYSRFKSAVISLSNTSFGVYLVHVIILNVVADFYLSYGREVAINFVWMLPSISVAVLVLSYILVVVSRRSYYMKKFAGF